MCFAKANATNYYLSGSGNDFLNNGKTALTPWQTIAKLKSVLTSLQPGDSVFFRCNDTFPGNLVLSKSGNTSKNIYFGSYGSGKKPVISGAALVNNWTQTAKNIWEATFVGGGSKVTNFFINGNPQQIGRWPNVSDPNKGYLSYESHSGTNQITDNQLTSATNWTGAEAVVRRVRWILDRLTIKSQTANTLLFTTNVSYEFLNGFGYFIQNDLRTLDQPGEWYYNPVTKKLSLYSETDPNTFITKAAQLNNLVLLDGLSYITIENLQFYGSGSQTIDIRNCNKLTIRNTEIDYSGENAINFYASNNIRYESNLINHTNNNAFTLNGCKNFVIRDNIIKNTALIAGMGLGADSQYNAMQFSGTNLLVETNRLDSVGYLGMNFSGDTITIKNNVISNYCMTKDDGGGIYTWGDGKKINYARKLIGNVVYNAIGAPEGSGWTGVAAEGIYIDDRSANVDMIGNTVFRCGNYGFHIHNANHLNIKRNTVFDNGTQLRMGHDNIATTFPITDCVVDSNLFVSKEAGQAIASFETIDNGIVDMGTFDYNYYCRPLDDKQTFSVRYVDLATVNESLTLQEWQSKYNKDQHSGKSPIQVAGFKLLGIKSSNFFFNSAFESNTSNWSTWANYNNGKMTMAPGEGYSGNALKASFTSSSGKTDGYMLITSNSFSFTKGKTYRVKFAAKGSKAGASIRLIPRKNGNPYNDVANPINFALNTSYNQYEFYLDASITEPNSRIDFEIREGQGDVWFDNLELVEVDIAKTNPDDYMLFEYNASKNDKTINIPGNYVDVKGNPVSGNVILKPFSSVIFFKNQSTSIGLLPEKTGSDIRLIPNPASTFVTIKSKEDIISICMNDMNGQVIRSFRSSGTPEYTINNLPKSGFYLVQVQTTLKTENRKLIIQN